MYSFNLQLLAKQNTTPTVSFFEAKVNSNASPCWRSIYAARMITGDLVKILEDRWKVSIIRSLFTNVEFNVIISMPLSLQPLTEPRWVKVGVWKIYHDIIPNRLNLVKCHVAIDYNCVLCKCMMESTLCLMKDYCFASCALFLTSHLDQSRFELCLMSKPPPGFFKINVDGAWRETHMVGGIEVVIWDKDEGFVAACVKTFEYVLSLGVYKIFFLESDSLQITSALNSIFPNMPFIGHIVEDSKAMLIEITGAFIAHARHQRNKADHRLVHSALSSSCDRAWFEEPSDVILGVLLSESSN
ncbi:hypothetical protein D8674_029118 [Pyrus ussuriensis x Pyrus communis]|uniref:RNase H type-1 domain-containing protein n=1 Tax=Pyrus ussuriensis x Pyrus communis TaxID=2448454 RepID=A0A5N5I2Y0_9ROSA|nr:hypothetical protein D8674_029118 [Pyrus ussuriensis x Pyrus communis]